MDPDVSNEEAADSANQQIKSANDGNASLYIESLMKLQRYDECYDYIMKHDHLSDHETLPSSATLTIADYKFDHNEYHEALQMYSRISNDVDQLIVSIVEMNDESLLNIAHCYQQLNEPQNALKCYYKYLHLHDGDSICINNIAILEYYGKNYVSALKMYSKMSTQHIRQKEVYFQIGMCYHHCNDWQRALYCFQQHLKWSKKNRDNCLISMAWIYSKKMDHYRNALQCYHKMSAQTITMKALQFDVAWCHQQNDEYTEALCWYKKYLSSHPNNVSTLHNIAWIYLNADDEEDADDNSDDRKQDNRVHDNYRSAKSLLLRALRIDPSHFWSNWTLALALRDIESNYPLALQCLEISLKAQPQSIPLLIDTAKVYKLMEDMDSAKVYYMKAVAVDECDCFANMEYAHFCALIGLYKLSYLHYQRSIKLIQSEQCDEDMLKNMNMELNYTNYGHVLHKLGKHREAISVVKLAFDLNANDCNTTNNLGYYCYLEGQYEESEKYLRMCLDIDPQHEFTNSTLGMLLFDTDRKDEAIAYFQIAVTLSSDTKSAEIGPKMLHKYGMILFERKEYDECIQILSRMVAEDAFTEYGEMGSVYRLLAKSYDLIGSTEMAMEWRLKALTLHECTKGSNDCQ